MIHGRVEENEPLAIISLGWLNGMREITVLVDTGFSGEVKIPISLAKELDLQITHTEAVFLANGHVLSMPVATALVSLENESKVVEASSVKVIPLLE